ncbi:MAG: nucleoside deaminase [Gemmatimonadota bacterium]
MLPHEGAGRPSNEEERVIDHERFMTRAIELARAHTPELPFGAVLIDTETEQIVAEGFSRSPENPLWHGEMDALNRYFASETRVAPERLQLYTTAEPCPMCAGALYWAAIPKVVFGTRVTTLRRLEWDRIDIPAIEVARRAAYARLAVVGPVLEAECNRLFAEVRSRD